MAKTKKINNKSNYKVSIFSSKTLKKVLSNYKKKQEQKKIKEIKLKKIAENNQILKEKKELR